MVDIQSISAAITGLKTAAEIAKAMKGLQDQADIQTKVIELQSAILDAQTSALAAQSDQLSMMQKMRQLEDEVSRVRAWEATKQRYQMVTPWSGCQVYALKDSSKDSDPPHWICPQCYEDGKKSILHNSDKQDRKIRWIIKCSRCSFESERHGDAERRYV